MNHNIFKHTKLFGLWFALSFLITTLGTWIFSEINGNTYFRAGEPNIWIRNVEWAAAILAIIIVAYELKNHIDTKYLNNKRHYDPWV